MENGSPQTRLFIAPQTCMWEVVLFRRATDTRLFLSRHKHAREKWLHAGGEQSRRVSTPVDLPKNATGVDRFGSVFFVGCILTRGWPLVVDVT
jgi:hypothetical protein